jgi:hypothetical protein
MGFHVFLLFCVIYCILTEFAVAIQAQQYTCPSLPDSLYIICKIINFKLRTNLFTMYKTQVVVVSRLLYNNEYCFCYNDTDDTVTK